MREENKFSKTFIVPLLVNPIYFFVGNLDVCDLIFQFGTPIAVRLDKDLPTFNT